MQASAAAAGTASGPRHHHICTQPMYVAQSFICCCPGHCAQPALATGELPLPFVRCLLPRDSRLARGEQAWAAALLLAGLVVRGLGLYQQHTCFPPSSPHPHAWKRPQWWQFGCCLRLCSAFCLMACGMHQTLLACSFRCSHNVGRMCALHHAPLPLLQLNENRVVHEEPNGKYMNVYGVVPAYCLCAGCH